MMGKMLKPCPEGDRRQFFYRRKTEADPGSENSFSVRPRSFSCKKWFGLEGLAESSRTGGPPVPTSVGGERKRKGGSKDPPDEE
jgi:hypothetical protein